MNTASVTFCLSKRELARCMRWISIRSRSQLLPLLVSGLFAVGFGVALRGSAVVTFSLVWLAAVAILFPLLVTAHAGRMWTKNSAFRGQQTIAVSAEGVNSETVVSNGLINWEWFTKFRESDFAIFLKGPTNVFLIIPKRALADVQELDAFRRIIVDNINKPAPADA